MRDEKEERKKQARSNKQTRQSMYSLCIVRSQKLCLQTQHKQVSIYMYIYTVEFKIDTVKLIHEVLE